MQRCDEQPQWNTTLASELIFAAGLALLIIASRWGIDVPNFKPVMAVALLAGFFFKRRWVGALAVVGGMLASDALLGFYQLPVTLTVYAALLSPLLAGIIIKRFSDHPLKMASGVLGFAGLSAVNFYVCTTLAVWYFTPWYPTTLDGLGTAFVLGLPFLKWTMLGNVTFSIILFALAAGVESLTCKRSDLAIAPRPECSD